MIKSFKTQYNRHSNIVCRHSFETSVRMLSIYRYSSNTKCLLQMSFICSILLKIFFRFKKFQLQHVHLKYLLRIFCGKTFHNFSNNVKTLERVETCESFLLIFVLIIDYQKEKTSIHWLYKKWGRFN